jgi:hypothetical protein
MYDFFVNKLIRIFFCVMSFFTSCLQFIMNFLNVEKLQISLFTKYTLVVY